MANILVIMTLISILLYIGLVKEVHGSYKIKHHLMGNPDKVCELGIDEFCSILALYIGCGNRLHSSI